MSALERWAKELLAERVRMGAGVTCDADGKVIAEADYPLDEADIESGLRLGYSQEDVEEAFASACRDFRG